MEGVHFFNIIECLLLLGCPILFAKLELNFYQAQMRTRALVFLDRLKSTSVLEITTALARRSARAQNFSCG